MPFLTGLLLVVLLGPAPANAYETENVVLVIIDGLRYSEGLGDPEHTFVPRMAALADEGALINDFQNDGYTYTSRAIPAIWCGAWTETISFSDPDCGGSSNKYAELPSVFEYFRQGLERPESDCVYTLKALCPWKASFDSNYGPDYWPLYHSVGVTDLDVWHETEQIISTLAPHFLLMYLADVDHEGHSGDWDAYTESISTADFLVGELWDVLQADSAYAGKTTMLVTNDHGRHDYDFRGHGDDCEGCRHIQLLAVGPDIQSGLQSDVSRTIPDIAPTIGELLGFTTPQATGEVMLELLVEETVSVNEPRVQAPASLRLNQVYPTPFNSELRIEFESTGRVPVALSIFNLDGTLVYESRPSTGSIQNGSLRWDGRDRANKNLPSGVYIVQLSDAQMAVSQKVIMLK